MCWKCPEPLSSEGRIGFRDLCPSCGRELHVCRNCSLYLPGANHDCREDQADPVKDKERQNLCEYFKPRAGLAGKAADGASTKARGDFDRLFGGS